MRTAQTGRNWPNWHSVAASPWQRGHGASAIAPSICRDAGIDVIIFRGSNRNKRRGIHNLGVYKNHIERLDLKRAVS